MKKASVRERVTVLKYLKGFGKYLKNTRKEELEVLAKFEHGFEAWLKVEFVSYCINELNLSSEEYVDLAIEHNIPLKNNGVKQIDIWVSNRKPEGEERRYHYIEFKYTNKRFKSPLEQVDEWITDYQSLLKISDRQKDQDISPDEGASVLFGIGFDAKEWLKLIKGASSRGHTPINIPIDGKLRAAVLRHKIELSK